MKKYLYIFNYPPEQEKLCQIEFFYLFKQRWQTKYHITETEISVDQSAFMKARIDIFSSHTSLQQVVKEVEKQNREYKDFKIIYVKNEITHVDYQQSLVWCKDVSWAIQGTVNMAKPKHVLAITKIEDVFIMGYYHHGTPSWQKHDTKPYTFSNSLDSKLARTLVNIASENKAGIRIVDPCCGMGTVVLEGLGLGIDIEGYDISREISYQARKNLLHFKYDPYRINRASIHDLQKHYDVAIIDMPYNLYTPITYEEQCNIIISARKICHKLVIVTHQDMTKEINKAGFLVINTCVLQKFTYASFKRYIWICV